MRMNLHGSSDFKPTLLQHAAVVAVLRIGMYAAVVRMPCQIASATADVCAVLSVAWVAILGSPANLAFAGRTRTHRGTAATASLRMTIVRDLRSLGILQQLT